MKVEIKRQVGFYEVDARLMLRLKPLVQFFQDVTGAHSSSGGCSQKWLMGQGNAWVIHRMCIQVQKMPCLEDDLTISTWHRGGKGFRSYRDFEVYHNGEKCISAKSLWLFIDLEKKKILKAPKEADQWYTVEDAHALDMDIDHFQPNLRFEPETTKTIHIRPSDHDPLCHVNTAVYLDFLENLVCGVFDDQKRLQQVTIQFNSEIAKNVTQVEIGMRANGPGFDFKLHSQGCVHAAGTFQLKDVK